MSISSYIGSKIMDQQANIIYAKYQLYITKVCIYGSFNKLPYIW